MREAIEITEIGNLHLSMALDLLAHVIAFRFNVYNIRKTKITIIYGGIDSV